MTNESTPDPELEVLAHRLARMFGETPEPSSQQLVGLDDFDDSTVDGDELTPGQLGELQRQFHQQMVWLFQEVKRQTGYVAVRFLAMIADIGGIATAKKLLAAPGVSDGFLALLEMNRLDLTVENLVLDPRYDPLFSQEELEIAEGRLREYLG